MIKQGPVQLLQLPAQPLPLLLRGVLQQHTTHRGAVISALQQQECGCRQLLACSEAHPSMAPRHEIKK